MIFQREKHFARVQDAHRIERTLDPFHDLKLGSRFALNDNMLLDVAHSVLTASNAAKCDSLPDKFLEKSLRMYCPLFRSHAFGL